MAVTPAAEADASVSVVIEASPVPPQAVDPVAATVNTPESVVVVTQDSKAPADTVHVHIDVDPSLPQLVIHPSVVAAPAAEDAKKEPVEPGSVQPIKPTGERTWALLDVVALLAFLAMVVVFVVYACGGDGAYDADVLELEKSFETPQWLWPTLRSTFTAHGLQLTVIAFVLSLAVSALIVSAPRFILKSVAWACVVATLVGAVVLAVVSQWLLAVVALVAFLVGSCIVRSLGPLVDFIAANLHVAGAALRAHKPLALASLAVFGLQLLWVLVSVSAYLRVATYFWVARFDELRTKGLDGATCRTDADCALGMCVHIHMKYNGIRIDSDKCTKPSSVPEASVHEKAVCALVVIACLWGLMVLRNICHATVARVVAGFWHGADPEASMKLVFSSMARSLSLSLGSISLISLCVVLFQAIIAVCDIFSDCLTKAINLFNCWTLVYVGIHGHSTWQASESVGQLFTQRGFTAIVESDLVAKITAYAATFVAMATVAISTTILHVGVDDGNISDAISVIVGFGIGLTPLAVVDGACAAVFVCFSEDPAALRGHHPQLYEALATAWRSKYPDNLSANGYY